MLALPVLLTLTLLSGSLTPLESMPVWLQNVMQLAPTTHLVNFAQEVSYRGADFEIVWTDLAAFSALTIVFFGISLMRFRAAMMAFQ
jgi:ABC-2 type transport system permease protein